MKSRLNSVSGSKMKYAPFGYGASAMRRNTHNLQRKERNAGRNRNARSMKSIPILNLCQMTDERWNELGTPKTKSGKRDIPLDPFVLETLEPMQESGFIFGGESPITMTTYNNTWRRIRKTIDLHGASAHVFRHSYLTYMAGEATDLKTLQAIAGHSTIDMTMNRYVHAQPEKIKDAGKKMNELLAG